MLDGTTLHARVLRTDTSDGEHLVDQLVEAIQEAGEARAVGVAVPSVVDFATGRVRASVNVPLADIALRDVLRSASASRSSSTTTRPARRSPRPTTTTARSSRATS